MFLTLNVAINRHASTTMTEAPFMLLSFITLFFMFKYADEKKWIWFLLGTLFTILSLYIRFPGAPLAMAVFIWLLFRRDIGKGFIYLGAVVVALGIWFIPLLISNQFIYLRQLDPGSAYWGAENASFFGRYIHHLLNYLFQVFPLLLLPSFAPHFFAGSNKLMAVSYTHLRAHET